MKATNWGDFDYASEVHAAVHQGPRRAAHLLLFAIVALFVVLTVWAAFATVDEVTRAQGRVIPSSQIQVVQSLEGGIVKELLVHAGDMVEQDQVLLRIDDTGFSSSMGELQAQRSALQGEISRMEAEMANADEITFPEGFAEQFPEVVQREQDLFRTRHDSLESQLNIVRQQAEQREQELDELKSKESQFSSSLNLARQELAINAPLAERGVVPQVDMLRIRREVTDLEGELRTTQTSIPRAESAIREAYGRVEDTFLTFQSDTQAALNKSKGDLAVLDESLRGASDRVARTEVRSPVAGIINKLNVTTLGGVIQPAQTLVEIVPLDDSLLVEARVRPSDVAFLRPGLDAMVKFSAYDFSIYGGLRGKVERISADTMVDEKTGEQYYQVVVRTDETHLGTEEHPMPIIPGMQASVDILTGEKTVLHYLLKPINKARDEALRER